MFAPLSIPDRFAAGFAQELAVRPWQIRAESQDGATMATAAMSLQDRYRDLSVPVAIIAGTEDKIVDVGSQSSWLHGEIPNSSLRLVPGAGHMVHHAVPGQVAAAVEAVSGGRRNGE